MKVISFITFLLFFFYGCEEKSGPLSDKNSDREGFISAVDISSFPEIDMMEPVFYDLQGNRKDFLFILKEQGINTVRLRLWVNPHEGHSGLPEVKAFSELLREMGFKIWLTLHYSDTWADPGKQIIPFEWEGLSFPELVKKVGDYTRKVVSEIQPDWIQVGNEINNGFLHPFGVISSNKKPFLDLLKAGTAAVRASSPETGIIIHYAGLEGAVNFFELINSIDYDLMGLSYYPKWHGKSIPKLKKTMINLVSLFEKEIVIAETAYPFTLDWNDWTTNIVGSEDQLILPAFPATPEGQTMFIQEIFNITRATKGGLGVCYWGAERIAWKGNQSRQGSSWENQALFDFTNQALPALTSFDTDNK